MRNDTAVRELDRSKRIYLVWGVALGLLTVLALVCWLLVPFFKTRTVVLDYSKATATKFPTQVDSETEAAIAKLGGQARALRHLRSYLRYPAWVAWYKDDAALLMRGCGEKGVDALIGLAANDADARTREYACMALVWVRPPPIRAVPSLVRALGDQDEDVRVQAARALSVMGSLASQAIPALEKALSDKDKNVRTAAAKALERIRGDGKKEKSSSKKPAPAGN